MTSNTRAPSARRQKRGSNVDTSSTREDAQRVIEAEGSALIAGAAADLEKRDPEFIRYQLPGMWLLTTIYFRAEVSGFDRIPEEGPVLFVGNHSGGNMTPDSMVFMLAFNTYFGVERPVYALAHSLVTSWPIVGSLASKWGIITAGPEAAQAALSIGSSVLVYPGGDVETHRPWSARHEIRFEGRKGFLRLAKEAKVPIVPVVSVGGQDTYLPLSDGRALARLLRLDRLARLKVLPISLALPWGLNVGDFLGHIPLPAKIRMEVLDPIDVNERFGEEADSDAAYDYVTGACRNRLRPWRPTGCCHRCCDARLAEHRAGPSTERGLRSRVRSSALSGVLSGGHSMEAVERPRRPRCALPRVDAGRLDRGGRNGTGVGVDRWQHDRLGIRDRHPPTRQVAPPRPRTSRKKRVASARRRSRIIA